MNKQAEKNRKAHRWRFDILEGLSVASTRRLASVWAEHVSKYYSKENIEQYDQFLLRDAIVNTHNKTIELKCEANDDDCFFAHVFNYTDHGLKKHLSVRFELKHDYSATATENVKELTDDEN